MRINIQFRNETAAKIYVVMDSRENHFIAGAGQVTFGPNVGDNPTYHVYNVGPNDQPTGEVYSDTFSTVRFTWHGPEFGGDLKWTGSKIERV